ncbi:MAG: MucB/RseB C-terminal domain-containing protein [Lysobacterales bacterium]
MRRRLVPFVLSSLLVTAAAAEPPVAWLQRMQSAQWQRSYEGVVVYVHDGRVDQVRIVNRPGSEPYQRFSSLSGERRELLRDGAEVRSLVPRLAPVSWPAMAARRSLLDPRRMAASYRIALIGRDHVAGFRAQLIEAEPQDGNRYGQRLWIDQDSGVLLGAALIGPERKLLEQVMFAQLAVDAESAQPEPTESPTVAAAEALTSLPGFVLIGRRVDPKRGLEQRVFSDGLATVSVYLETRNDVPAGAFASRRGAVQLYGRQQGTLRVLAVGAIPPEAVRRWVDMTIAATAQ